MSIALGLHRETKILLSDSLKKLLKLKYNKCTESKKVIDAFSQTKHTHLTTTRIGEQQGVVGTLANKKASVPSQGDSWLLPVVAMWG